jgi:hypothetical protein
MSDQSANQLLDHLDDDSTACGAAVSSSLSTDPKEAKRIADR